MADKEIFEDNIKRLINTVGAEQKIPDDKKSEILNSLLSLPAVQIPSQKAKTVWLITRKQAAKLAVAAVIVITVGLFIVHLGPDKRTVPKPDTAKSQLSPTTLLSMSLAYQKEGLKGLEEHCDKVYKTMYKETPKITLSDILEELNNDKNGRI